MISVKVGERSYRREQEFEQVNSENLKANLDMIDEVREAANLREFAAKQRTTRHYNSKIVPREMKQGTKYS